MKPQLHKGLYSFYLYFCFYVLDKTGQKKAKSRVSKICFLVESFFLA